MNKKTVIVYLFMLTVSVISLTKPLVAGPAQVPAEGLSKNLVCMVNDKFMNKEQIPVPFEGKTYYGCCKGCVLNLQNNRSLRVAVDPLTGAEVDKAEAFIASKPEGDGDDVLYFQSQENHEAYLQSRRLENMSYAEKT